MAPADRSAAAAAVADALRYPFPAPPGSFVFDGRAALPLGDEAAFDARGRTALLAYGANAAPERLAAKLAGLAQPRALPVLEAALRGFDIVHSAHISPYGAVAGTLRAAAGCSARVHVVLALPEELAALTATEPNYVLAVLPRGAVAVAAAASAELGPVSAYVSRHGCLVHRGAPVGVAAADVSGPRHPTLSQPELQEAVRDRLAPGIPVEQFVAESIADPDVRAARTALLKRDALARVV